jgi:uncharacterized peroxidase-related enzyme
MPHIELRNDLYGITSLLDYRKETAAPICELTDLLLCGESTLSKTERELIAAHVSRLNDCTFCSSAHAAVTCRHDAGMEEPLSNNIDTIVVSEKMKTLLNIAAKVQQGGNYVTQNDVNAAKEKGATDKEIHDTVLIAALFCLYNRYVDGLATAIPANPAFYDALSKRITARGYKMPENGYHALQF